MSMESAQKFYEKLEGDIALIERLSKMSDGEKERLVKGELGYDFTQEEMQKVVYDKQPELADEDLEAVVGGSDFTDGFGDTFKIGLIIGGVGGIIGSAAA